ncbi:hypothetical protein F8M41_022193 [Gigaspora margarita]|uniref:Uncharacterized protein n=1 Tax=Gigaspora margarita TaxID=4874 RepID=A0A8H4EIC0_GIGMA|nr:hypothetical protein F8M41_022193 [Gigaspora margarita]
MCENLTFTDRTACATQINDNDFQDIRIGLTIVLNFACDITKGTEDGVRNKKEVPIAYIQLKDLKRKCDADKENEKLKSLISIR